MAQLIKKEWTANICFLYSFFHQLVLFSPTKPGANSCKKKKKCFKKYEKVSFKKGKNYKSEEKNCDFKNEFWF